MSTTLKKIFKISLSIVSTISHFMLLWIFISTVEIALVSTVHKKANDFNIFVLSNSIKSNIESEKSHDRLYEDMIAHNYDDAEYEEDDTDEPKTMEF